MGESVVLLLLKRCRLQVVTKRLHLPDQRRKTRQPSAAVLVLRMNASTRHRSVGCEATRHFADVLLRLVCLAPQLRSLVLKRNHPCSQLLRHARKRTATQRRGVKVQPHGFNTE